MRTLASLTLVLMLGCDAVEEDVPGKLVRVEVIAENQGCLPARFTGDAGVQFFGIREDGGLVITLSAQAHHGPLLDGGSLSGIVREPSAPIDPTCRVGSEWTVTDAGLRLRQTYSSCAPQTDWFPRNPECFSSRQLVLTEVGTCSLRCVRIPVGGGSEVECKC